MDKIKFMEENNIAIFVEIDLDNKHMSIERRYEEELESYSLFYDHIIYNENINSYEEYLDGQLLPRIWGQGKTTCIYCKPTKNKIICLFYDFEENYKKEYLYADELNAKIEDMYNK